MCARASVKHCDTEQGESPRTDRPVQHHEPEAVYESLMNDHTVRVDCRNFSTALRQMPDIAYGYLCCEQTKRRGF